GELNIARSALGDAAKLGKGAETHLTEGTPTALDVARRKYIALSQLVAAQLSEREAVAAGHTVCGRPRIRPAGLGVGAPPRRGCHGGWRAPEDALLHIFDSVHLRRYAKLCSDIRHCNNYFIIPAV
ncbi:hypothetical protein OEZ74_26930, partial [Leclercia adecarboxylata]|uniref:hypothetical protein n=1 Tax=Leclercia adecarboxylata TaxID=83655 RepID=UPI00234E28BE